MEPSRPHSPNSITPQLKFSVKTWLPWKLNRRSRQLRPTSSSGSAAVPICPRRLGWFSARHHTIFFVDRIDDMLELVGGLIEAAPSESIFAVESDERFDFGLLPDSQEWDVRTYRPAVVGVYRKPIVHTSKRTP